MSFPTLKNKTELKKDYKFMWVLSFPPEPNTFSRLINLKQPSGFLNTNKSPLDKLKGMIDSLSENMQQFIEKFDFLRKLSDKCKLETIDYVSALCNQITLPDDEIKITYYDIGMLKYPIPSGIEMRPINVTYYDDTDETVYTFHKIWQQTARVVDSLGMNSLYNLSLVGTYYSFENTLNLEEYAGMFKLATLNRNIVDLINLPMQKDDSFIKPKIATVFPNIFPIKISRGTQNKGGNGLGKVSVTYERIPNLKNRPPAFIDYSGNKNKFLSKGYM